MFTAEFGLPRLLRTLDYDYKNMKKGFVNSVALTGSKNDHESKYGIIKHDESGQVFTEVSCPGGPMTLDWVWKTTGDSGEAAHFRSSDPGCSSLVNMAIRSAVTHSFNITAESLQGLPGEIAHLLWERLVALYALLNFDSEMARTQY